MPFACCCLFPIFVCVSLQRTKITSTKMASNGFTVLSLCFNHLSVVHYLCEKCAYWLFYSRTFFGIMDSVLITRPRLRARSLFLLSRSNGVKIMQQSILLFFLSLQKQIKLRSSSMKEELQHKYFIHFPWNSNRCKAIFTYLDKPHFKYIITSNYYLWSWKKNNNHKLAYCMQITTSVSSRAITFYAAVTIPTETLTLWIGHRFFLCCIRAPICCAYYAIFFHVFISF